MHHSLPKSGRDAMGPALLDETTVPVPVDEAATEATAPTRIAAVADLSRARQALLSVAQPALGAILAARGLPPSRTMALGVLAATTGYLAVFSLNDVLDVRADADALRAGKDEGAERDIDTIALRHPLARRLLPASFGVAWVVTLAVVATVAAWLLEPAAVALFALAVALEAAYCALRRVTHLKTLVSGVMVGIGGLAGWAAVGPLTWDAAAFFGFLAAWEIAGRNLSNDLADIAADSATGIRTVATVRGPRTSVRWIAYGTLATLLALAALPLPPLSVAATLAAGVLTMAAPLPALRRDPTPGRAAGYFNRASLLPALVFSAAFVAALLGSL